MTSRLRKPALSILKAALKAADPIQAVLRHASIARQLQQSPAMYGGRILESPLVSSFRGRSIELFAVGETTGVEADGEPVGKLPLCVRVLPRAIRLLGVRANAL